MTVGNRFQIIDHQTFLGQEVVNVYFYRQTAGLTEAAADLADLYVSTILPELVNIQSTQVTHTQIVCNNVDNLSDYVELPLTVDNTGLESGEALPPYACYAFRFNRATRAVRNGQKRIAGIVEAGQSNGVAVSGDLPQLSTIASVMAQQLTSTDNTFQPVIYHRFPADVTHPHPPLSLGTDYDISGVQYVRISTQNTRKFGRGS